MSLYEFGEMALTLLFGALFVVGLVGLNAAQIHPKFKTYRFRSPPYREFWWVYASAVALVVGFAGLAISLG